MAEPRFTDGIYYVVRGDLEGKEALAAVMLPQGQACYAFTQAEGARVLAAAQGGEVRWHSRVEEVLAGLPDELVGLLVDYDPVLREGFLLRANEFLGL